ncbi:hypothetical protein B0H63DRAFT_490288 [Podospora didyma]|uniref:Uncharacterized protein n=1 Tax=Podospora didyma TaxID=330526 RepID=A0AAE0JYK0_9PEZI|nr:hypothetical protein B0H63DRAFT_490288 [Podospora didyma]
MLLMAGLGWSAYSSWVLIAICTTNLCVMIFSLPAYGSSVFAQGKFVMILARLGPCASHLRKRPGRLSGGRNSG